MKIQSLLQPLYLLFSLLTLNGIAGDVQKAPPIPKGYIENKGQIIDENRHQRNDVLYIFYDKGFSLILRANGFTYQFTNIKSNNGNFSEAGDPSTDLDNDDEDNPDPLLKRMSSITNVNFVKANKNITVDAKDQLPFYYNYFTEYISVGNVHLFNQVTYHNVYDHLDLLFTFKENEKGEIRPEYEWIIHPHGNANDIELEYSGAKEMFVNLNGTLTLGEELGFIQESKPIIFENKVQIKSEISYELKNNILSFKHSKLKEKLDYIIDPEIAYSFYHSAGANMSSKNDLPDEIVVDHDKADGSDYIIISGRTTSKNNFASTISYDQCFNSLSLNPNDNSCGEIVDDDAFVAKYKADNTPIFVTYFGGVNAEKGYSVCTNPLTNEIYMAGKSNSVGLPSTDGTNLHNAAGSSNDGIVAAFNKNGTALDACTYIGGSKDDYFLGITSFLDPRDGIVKLALTGKSESSESTSNIPFGSAQQLTYSGNPTNCDNGGTTDACAGDIMMELLNASNLAQVWGSYFGTTGARERGHTVAVSKDGITVYMVGSVGCNADDEPLAGKSEGVYQVCKFDDNSCTGADNESDIDAMLISWNSADGKVNWRSFYGGPGNERGRAIKVDDAGYVYIAGHTVSTCDASSPDRISCQSAVTCSQVNFTFSPEEGCIYFNHVRRARWFYCEI
ncbi:MAG: hypothetical protein H0W62_06860 [Chitinophagales bacterium]|nr:hypothetical protein [Chitinophagales bacterium]